MNIDKKIYIIEQLIQEADSDLRILLLNETFTKYIEASDMITIEFLCQNAKQLLQILFVNYEQIQPFQYDIVNYIKIHLTFYNVKRIFIFLVFFIFIKIIIIKNQIYYQNQFKKQIHNCKIMMKINIYFIIQITKSYFLKSKKNGNVIQNFILSSLLNQQKFQEDNTYSILITKVWEIIELNIEEILQQIEIHFNHLFDILTYQFIPDVQWAQAVKILQLIQKRSQILITKSLNANNQLLYHFLPYLYNNVRNLNFSQKIKIKKYNLIKKQKNQKDEFNSVAQIILIYYENQFHQQQLEFLQIGIQQYYTFDFSSAINFTYIIHEIMVRIQSKELMEYLLSNQVMMIANNVIQKEKCHFIVRKNAAHIISLISNYYSLDLQNLYLDEPYNQLITEEFRKTEFFRNFDIISIQNILENTLSRRSKVGLLDVKLIEIIDNIVRISDIELWQRVEQSNVMETIIDLVKKYNHSDILNQYFYNMIAFILDRALNDFHPFWCLKLLTKNKLLTQIDRQLFAFEQQLQIKLIRDSDFLPYYNELKVIESTLKKSQVWKIIKEQIEKYEDKHKFKLGEDQETPQVDIPFIISAIQEDQSDEIIEPENNIFIDCFNKQSPMDSLNNNDDSEDENKMVGTFSGLDIVWNILDTLYTLNKLKNVFEQMDLQEQECQDDNQKGKKIRILSNSLNTETSHLKQENHQRYLKSDHIQMQRLSMSTSTHLKRLNLNFEEFTIEIVENKKVLKNKCIMKVDEIDFMSNQQKN